HRGPDVHLPPHRAVARVQHPDQVELYLAGRAGRRRRPARPGRVRVRRLAIRIVPSGSSRPTGPGFFSGNSASSASAARSVPAGDPAAPARTVAGGWLAAGSMSAEPIARPSPGTLVSAGPAPGSSL